jgi:hypothetical protein
MKTLAGRIMVMELKGMGAHNKKTMGDQQKLQVRSLRPITIFSCWVISRGLLSNIGAPRRSEALTKSHFKANQ